MIRTHIEGRAGDLGTVCDISGTEKDVYNDFRALIDLICDHKELVHIFQDAWDNIMEVRGWNDIMEVKGIDKNNTSNKD